MKHHAIIVTTFDEKLAQKAHEEAMKFCGKLTTHLQKSGVNGLYSFAVLPDGSQEGGSESSEGNKTRQQLKDWIRVQSREDGSNPFNWVEAWFDEENKLGVNN